MHIESESPSTIQSQHFAVEATDAASKSVEADRVARIVQFVQPGDRVLDLGCNDGAVADVLLRKGAVIFASDFPRVVIHARKKFPKGVNPSIIILT